MHMRKPLSRILCAIVVPAFALTAIAQDSQDPKQRVEALEQQVQKNLQEQKPELAIPLLREIVSIEPNNLNAHADLGVLLFFQGNYSEAIPQMHSAVQSQPDLWRIEALLGIAEKRTGDPSAAQEDLERAFARLDDKKIAKEAGLELVELDSSSGQFAKASSVTEKLEELLPEDPQILFVAYEISVQMMDQSLLNMLLVAPDSGEMHMIMGGELGRHGDHANAIAQYREAIKLNPMLPGVHYELAEQLRASPDPAMNAQAESEFKAAVKANQYDEKAWCRLGDSVAEAGDFKAAEEDYKKALVLQPRDADAQTGLAIALITMNQMSEAVPLLESAVKNDPTNIVAHYRLSVLYRRAGRIAEAQHEMSEYNHYKELKDKMAQVFKQFNLQPDQK